MDSIDTKTWIELGDLILKAVVAIGAGIWAVILLVLLNKRQLAIHNLRLKELKIHEAEQKIKHDAEQFNIQIRDEELKAIRTKLQIHDLELKVKQQAVISVDIQPTIQRSPDNDYIILAVVVLTNHGSRNTRIKWKDEPPAFYVRLAKFGDDRQVRYDDPDEFRVKRTRAPEYEPISHLIRAGATESICFAGKVSVPGLYLLSFRGTVDEKEREEAKKLGAELPVAWTSNKHVFIGDNPNQV